MFAAVILTTMAHPTAAMVLGAVCVAGLIGGAIKATWEYDGWWSGWSFWW